jgi:hypothetical protein
MKFDSKVIPDFLSNQELALIEKVVEANRSDATTYYDTTHDSGHSAVTHSIHLNHPLYSDVANILVPRFQQHFGQDIGLDVAHILNAYVPYGIHTDVMSAGFDPNGTRSAAWTFIIPLDNYDSNTLVFEQQHDTIKTLSQWIAETGAEPHGIDDQLHQQYLTHVDRLDLRYLDVEDIFPWRKGSLFAASRQKFHTSDNFPARGVECKRAIVIWSSVPKQSCQTA